MTERHLPVLILQMNPNRLDQVLLTVLAERQFSEVTKGHCPVGDVAIVELTPLTENDLFEFFTEQFAGTRLGDQIPWNSVRGDWPEDQTRPAITSLQLDREGNLWVEEGRIDYDSPGIWHVVGPSGRYLATATMPSRFRPFDIGRETVLGVWRDDLDVEYVQKRVITKSDDP